MTGAFLNPADILDFREQCKSFEEIVAWGTLPINLDGARTAQGIRTARRVGCKTLAHYPASISRKFIAFAFRRCAWSRVR